MSERTEVVTRDALTWMADTLGSLLLGYLLNCDDATIQAILSEHPPSSAQLDVLETLSARRAELSKELDEAGVRKAVRHWLLQPDEDGRSTAAALRALTCQEPLRATASTDELERTFITLARVVYPAFLIPTEKALFAAMPELADFLEGADQRVSTLIESIPESESFSGAVAADETIGKAFQGIHPVLGGYIPIYFNAGHGGSLFSKRLPEMVLWAAWRQVRDTDPTEEQFVSAALAQLAIVRRVLGGRTSKIKAKYAFAGVLMPAASRMDLGDDGIVMPVTDADRRRAPGVLQQQTGGATGAGDIVLEYPYPYKAWMPRAGHDVTAWQEKVPEPVELERVILCLRASLVLAVKREHRAHIIRTWQYVNDPLAMELGALPWTHPQWGRGLTSTELTDAEIVAWGEWYRLLRVSHTKKIDVAVTRMLKAVAERREPSDVLIDSVIAWENIFGTAEGEPTFRVTACLAKLLKDSLAERRALRQELATIYRLRSDVVHGNRSLTDADFKQCDRALDVAIDAIRVLVDKRSDLLAQGDGGWRSTAVLLAD